ncbi:FAD-dependent oxidoreductase [Gracilinema caldarium]|uniref:FAD-dependent oxidoreductase n=1 Tax=Gracilinema caldarium TaxID=215591 RepID=UPI0026F2E53F|nr:FAD-dependent oxidoreductase [Gracilinema caldarium]
MPEKAKKIIIVGGVAAGATAAARIRRLDENAEIILLERGPYVSFANCGLPYHIAGTIEKRSKLLLQTPEGFFSRYRVQVLLNTEAVDIDRTNRKVTVRDNKAPNPEQALSTIDYDALILAQGGTPIIPPLPGVDQSHVFKLWTIPDMDAINKYIKEHQPKHVVVVGGGFIGLETAEAFVERGLSVTIVELTDHLMPPMDLLYGKRIQERFEAAGATVLVKKGVQSIQKDKVTLNDGSEIPADMVLLSVGVRPNTELAKKAGLEIGNTGALVVDEYLKTQDPYIWAAGDMVEVVSRISGAKVRIPLAGPANRQGRIAATNVVASLSEARGEVGPIPLKYKGAIGTSVVKIFDETAASTGFSLAAARKAGFDAKETTILKAHHATYYPGDQDLLLTLVYEAKTGKLLGAQAYGKEGVEKRIDATAVTIYAQLTVENLTEIDFAYAPPYSSANDPLNMAAFTAMNALSGYSNQISADELPLDGSVLILDVRTYGEYAKGHLADAIHIPLDEIRDRLEEIPHDKPIHIISEGGFEGHLANRILTQQGYQDTAYISGGWATLRLRDGLAIEA